MSCPRVQSFGSRCGRFVGMPRNHRYLRRMFCRIGIRELGQSDVIGGVSATRVMVMEGEGEQVERMRMLRKIGYRRVKHVREVETADVDHVATAVCQCLLVNCIDVVIPHRNLTIRGVCGVV